MKCKICGNVENNRIYDAREMMFGYKDVFRYFQCAKCFCLQIEELPSNISKYYPDNYYSHQIIFNQSMIKKNIIRLRDKYALFGKGFIGKLLFAMYPRENLYSLNILPVDMDTSVLDIGCGNGKLLYSMRKLGLKNLLGADPFIEEDIEYENGLEIKKKDVFNIESKWDIVMFHHSFEHIPNPAETLKAVSNLLTPEGYCVIRIPIVSSYAWSHYEVNWVQLDAPRHFFLHSIKSMNILAELAKLDLFKVVYDSTAFQFWGSEQYINEIPLMDERSYLQNHKDSIFSKKEISAFTKHAKALNKTKRGDQAVFYLRKN